MQLHIYKYQGTGNDFIILDGWKSLPQLSYEQIAAMCDRHFGIGADGLMILRKHQDYDFEMLYYNSNGYPGSMCGNGSRCLVRFAQTMKYAGVTCRFLAPDGAHEAILLANGWVSVSMADVHHPKELENGDYELNTGSPHYISWRDPEALNLIEEAKKIRYNSEYFENGINVNFVVAEQGGIRIRTYERGVEDETLSCGTGITAAVIAAVAAGKVEKGKGYCDVKALGGGLRIRFNEANGIFSDIRLEGPAEKVFEGILKI